ncbi:MAG: hypothetical protein ACREKB_18560 [Candidatus Rokuibacteriota bacterium]
MPFLFATAILVIALGVASPAHAYLDAGAGSMIVQLLLGGFAGLLVIGKLYWMRIKSIFVRQPPDASPDAGKQL